jgi:hypothetical protein
MAEVRNWNLHSQLGEQMSQVCGEGVRPFGHLGFIYLLVFLLQRGKFNSFSVFPVLSWYGILHEELNSSPLDWRIEILICRSRQIY